MKAPVPIRPWKGIYNAQNYGRKCPTLDDLQKLTPNELKNTDVENCLNMAIYTTNVRFDRSKHDGNKIGCLLNLKRLTFVFQLNATYPVMVYVHGGRFIGNSAEQYPPNYLLERDIVLVVIQFRLNVLGKFQS